MVLMQSWTWEQGSDLIMSLRYSEGDEGLEQPVDLTNYSFRMDLAKDNTRVFTLNSADIPDIVVDQPGPSDNEVTLGADGRIIIKLARSLTLPGGPVYQLMTTGEKLSLNYDMFLRNGNNEQFKFLKGKITVNPSYTLWA